MAKIDVNNEIGKRYSKLVIISFAGRCRNSTIKVLAKCDCGAEKIYFLNNLRRKNHTTSCGCEKIRTAGDGARKHGMGNKRNPLYLIWSGMKNRCYNKNAPDYNNYGGRGVKICDEWVSDFKAYYDWCIENGWQKGLQIDKDKIGDGLLYSPKTCTILTSKENQNNRSNNIVVDYQGETMTLKAISEKYDIKYLLLWRRFVKLKWDIHKAVTQPIRIIKPY